MFSFKKQYLITLAGGFVLGKAGQAIFGSKKAKEIYTKAATGAYIAKDAIMEEFEKIQAAALDIAAEARIEADNYQAEKDAEYAEAAESAEEEEFSDM